MGMPRVVAGPFSTAVLAFVVAPWVLLGWWSAAPRAASAPPSAVLGEGCVCQCTLSREVITAVAWFGGGTWGLWLLLTASIIGNLVALRSFWFGRRDASQSGYAGAGCSQRLPQFPSRAHHPRAYSSELVHHHDARRRHFTWRTWRHRSGPPFASWTSTGGAARRSQLELMLLIVCSPRTGVLPLRRRCHRLSSRLPSGKLTTTNLSVWRS